MSTLEVDHTRNPPPESGYGSGESNASRSPLNMSLGFLKGFTEKRSTRNGQPPKRRGPKPDSKPALTRRQELNRQAQRSHRERKELYIKALEDQIGMLKEEFSKTTRDREAIERENKKLKQLLQQHGIPYNGNGVGLESLNDFASTSGSISGSYAGSATQSFSPPSSTSGPAVSQNTLVGAGTRQPGIDYEQSGIDFVLTLEQPCKDHLQPLMVRAQSSAGANTGGNGLDDDVAAEISGHALMFSTPPFTHILNHPDEDWSFQDSTTDYEKLSAFNGLLDTSLRLELDGEVTPVMAWGMLLQHPRLGELKTKDFQRFQELLIKKVRCYGFGAVLEEFEVRDTIDQVLATKDGPYNIYIG